MEKNLILTRGIPGSGKSSFAELLGTDAICCADDYFMVDCVYNWKAEEIGAAHLYCQNKCLDYMKAETKRIVIANTNTTEKEMKPYFDMAKEYNYKVFSIIVENRHGGKNTHNVPETTLEKMRARFNISL